jgi:hypothetical protein
VAQALPKLIGGVLELVGLWDCCAPLLGRKGEEEEYNEEGVV